MAAELIQPGMLTTVQDLGREHYRAQGVVLSGAADGFAHRAANWLVGNHENLPTLEVSLGGLELVFQQATVVAVTGYGVQASLDTLAIDCWKPIPIRAGNRLKITYRGIGSRSYLAVAGGWEVPCVLGSYSTYASAGWGGFQGRALRKGDLLRFPPPPHLHLGFSIASSALPAYSATPVIRVMKGPEWDWFTPESQHQFLEETLLILPQSNRMGYRLQAQMQRLQNKELLSTAVSPGTIQGLPDGHLVLMMNDAPATGGYPRVAQVVEADLCLCGQLVPGNRIRFVAVTPAEAEEIYVSYQQRLQLLKQRIFQRLHAN